MADACVVLTVAVVLSVVVIVLCIFKFIVIVVGDFQSTRAQITLCEHQLKYGGHNFVCVVCCLW